MKLLKSVTLSILFSVLIVQADTLTVITTGLRSEQGRVQFSLYNKDGTIPDKALNKYYQMQRVSISDRQAKVVFKDLPKGRYAVNIFHDENNNRKIDKGLFLPKEGIGLSNFKTIDFFHLPDFKKASFLLDCDKKIQIKTSYL